MGTAFHCPTDWEIGGSGVKSGVKSVIGSTWVGCFTRMNMYYDTIKRVLSSFLQIVK